MDLCCDHCGYQGRFGLSHPPINGTCMVCGLGHLRQGVTDSGFEIDNGAMVPFNLDPLAYTPLTKGTMGVPSQFNYFVGELGDGYKDFIMKESVYVGKFTNILVPEPERFAWLSPYTGNKHNRCHFTQMVLATVAGAKFVANGGRFPRLIEPFVGSGQVFLNACQWGPSLNGGVPLFHEVIAGDLNPYVIRAYELIASLGADGIEQYRKLALEWDDNGVAASFKVLIEYLHNNGAKVLGDATKPDPARRAAMMYIYLVNRCTRGSKLSPSGGVVATPREKVQEKVETIRKRELATLSHVCETIHDVAVTFDCQDFEETCKRAAATDIVFMDCPFPTFTNVVPQLNIAHPETFKSVTANTYGTGDDGATLQARIVRVAKELVAKGTTVILCNFANPGLIRAYADLLDDAIPALDRRTFTFTYRSPSTESEAYQLTILAGHNAFQVLDVVDSIRENWNSVGGDDNFEVDSQEFFNPPVAMEETDVFDGKAEAAEPESDVSDYEPGEEDD